MNKPTTIALLAAAILLLGIGVSSATLSSRLFRGLAVGNPMARLIGW
ncbi:MAG: hypothetical protein QOF48_1136 [Verrucomicrobiota bacterium]|jgi:hypothetical protein